MLLLMRGGKLHTNPGLAARHNREREADHINAFFEHIGGHIFGQAGLTQHYRHNRMNSRANIETGIGHFLAKIFRVFIQFLTKFRGCSQHLENFQADADHNRSYRIRKEIGAATLAQ